MVYFLFISVENWSRCPIVLISKNTKASTLTLTTPSQEQVNQKLLGAWNAHLVFIGPGEVFKRSVNIKF